MKEIYYAYVKATKVLESSNTQVHLESARRYINNFFRIYSQPIVTSRIGVEVSNHMQPPKLDVRLPNTIAAHMYEELIIMLEHKEKNLQ